MKDLKPKIFNITVPGPAKEILTSELKPGERKRTESAHNGADTVFYRTINYADGSEEKETWRSHYVPWQAVYLVGMEPVAPTPEETLIEDPLIPDPNAPPAVPNVTPLE
jgi:hypothetical protein